MSTFTEKKTVAVFGAGQVGEGVINTLLSENLAKNTIVISRGGSSEKETEFANAWEPKGATVEFCGNYDNEEKITEILGKHKVDVVLIALRFTVELAEVIEPAILRAAMAAGVKVFCPTEFGQNSLWVNRGTSNLFDAKGTFGEKLVATEGIDWIMFYTGCFMHYHLPRYAWGNKKLSIFGDLDSTKKNPLTNIKDIGTLIARCLVDDRCVNKCVQFDFGRYSQQDQLDLLNKYYPNRKFELDINSNEFITKEALHGDNSKISAAGGHEPDKERHGINYILWVDQKPTFAPYDDERTVNVKDLFPNYQNITVEEVMSSKDFVFGDADIDEVAPLIK